MNNTDKLKDIRLFLFDMDGTLYLGDNLFPFTKDLLKTIKAQGKNYLFLTNNSSKSVSDYVKRLAKLGVEAEEREIVTSSQATSDYLNANYPGKRFYALGTDSFKAELVKSGVEITDTYSESGIDGLVMGFDTELSFKKLEDASKLLLRDITYIATNPDLVCPTEYGYVPDCGSVSIMLKNATGKTPYFIGKPRPDMMFSAIERVRKYDGSVSVENTLVVGDRVYTDIACGVNGGATTVLVLSGESTVADAEASDKKPTFILRDCGELLDIIKN